VSTSHVIDSPVVIYDGDCGFCQWSLDWAKRHLSADVEARPWQAGGLSAYGVTEADAQVAVQWVDAQGVQAGHRAFAAWMRASGRLPWRVLAAVLTAPGVDAVARRGYAVLAAHRHQLPGPWRANGVCRVER
jgi:predicted DCC family thiol-disulfide oxidoreductase YuxK